MDRHGLIISITFALRVIFLYPEKIVGGNLVSSLFPLLPRYTLPPIPLCQPLSSNAGIIYSSREPVLGSDHLLPFFVCLFAWLVLSRVSSLRTWEWNQDRIRSGICSGCPILCIGNKTGKGKKCKSTETQSKISQRASFSRLFLCTLPVLKIERFGLSREAGLSWCKSSL